ncbi:serine hydrolase [Pararhodobacter sp. SW119]|uniref:serine hydrolase domain-containing protein n=1 Tax=Pararhodobacter sp. SW119 TaxID=2780075 RepID=UPI001FD7FA9C|nr:serine hydrolase [Pararhodobacter sp. SW119]
MGLVLEGATGMPVAEYLESRLWGPLGAERDAFWSTDRQGQEFALCCLNATLRDYARFGRLYLEGGARDGRQIIPAVWVDASVTPEAAHLQPGDNSASSWTFGYGYKWWIPENPQGDFTAIGVWGQYIYVDPARGVIVVKTSADPDFDDNDHESVAAFRAIARAVTADRGM